MYIVPNTTIYILNNIPLNKSYEHTVYYPDKDTQAQAFMKYKKYTLTDYSYQRSQLGTIRVQLKYEELIDCNYLMFKNTNYENKWFYAFITGIGYVSNDVTDVYYDLDVMQTWCYDYTFGKTFVERHHDAYDRLYGNTVPEGLELGSEYRLIQGKSYSYAKPLAWVIIATETVKDESAYQISGIITGVYSGLRVYYIEDILELNRIIGKFIDKGLEDAIVAFYQVPKIDKYHMSDIQTDEITFTQQMNLGNGYKPRNKKLFSYPYSFLEVYNTLGTSVELKFDQFENNGASTVTFKVEKVIFPQANVVITPKWYRGYMWDYEYSSVYGLFPTCAFAGDAFKVWWAQNKNSYLASMNAIGNTYDTNQAIAQNNYTMAGLNAANARTNAHIQANSALAQAENSNKASLAINTAQSNKSVVDTAVNTGVNAIQNAGKALASGFDGISAVTAGAITAVGGIMSETFNQDIYSARANQINTQLLNSQIGAQAGEAISANTFQTAMKNATLAQTNAQLSNLNAYQNATAQLMAKKQDIQHMPNSAHGNAMCDGLNYARNTAGFIIRQWGLSYEYAVYLDDYFDKYGYAMMRNFVPSRLNRKHWSYLKTVGCNIKGNVNNTDLLTIKTIYDNGITTWKNLEEVGDYTLDNTIDEPTTADETTE